MWKYERFFRTVSSCLLKIDYSDEMRRSDCKFSVVSEICFENVKNSETDTVSEKKLVKTAWIMIFEKSEELIRSC